MAARLGELIQEADGLDLARAKTPFGPLKWVKIPLGARPGALITHDRRHLSDRTSPQRPQLPHSLNAATSATVCPSRSSSPIPSALPALWPLTG